MSEDTAGGRRARALPSLGNIPAATAAPRQDARAQPLVGGRARFGDDAARSDARGERALPTGDGRPKTRPPEERELTATRAPKAAFFMIIAIFAKVVVVVGEGLG